MMRAVVLEDDRLIQFLRAHGWVLTVFRGTIVSG
jgi:hypothetical protein